MNGDLTEVGHGVSRCDAICDDYSVHKGCDCAELDRGNDRRDRRLLSYLAGTTSGDWIGGVGPMAIVHHAPVRPEDVEVIELSASEYERAVQRALDDIGLTYDQLAAQARRGSFSSLRARQVWLLIGGDPRHGG